MNNVIEEIEKMSDKEAFLSFVQKLIDDYKANPQEWENKTVDEYLDSMMSWVEDYSKSEFNDIDWNKTDYSVMAKILYMGKIYE